MTQIRPVVHEIDIERDRQDAKWGHQNYPDGAIGREVDVREAARAKARCQGNVPGEDNWRDILEEEVTEAYAAQSSAELRAELVQVAAVCVAWIEAMDRRVGAEEKISAHAAWNAIAHLKAVTSTARRHVGPTTIVDTSLLSIALTSAQRAAAAAAKREVYQEATGALRDQRRCPNCQHLPAAHQEDGCWFTLSYAGVGKSLVCQCSVPVEALTAISDEGTERG